MNELDFDERVQGIVCVFGGVAEGLEEDVDEALDFWVMDDFTESLQTLLGPRTDLLVAVIQHRSEWGNDLRQAVCNCSGSR